MDKKLEILKALISIAETAQSRGAFNLKEAAQIFNVVNEATNWVNELTASEEGNDNGEG